MGEEFTKIAEEIFMLVGPRENILSARNCMDNLKLKLKDKEKVDVGILKRVDGVCGIIETQDQLQIIIVHRNSNEIIAEFIKISGIKDSVVYVNDEIKQKKLTPIKSVLKKISNIFI